MEFTSTTDPPGEEAMIGWDGGLDSQPPTGTGQSYNVKWPSVGLRTVSAKCASDCSNAEIEQDVLVVEADILAHWPGTMTNPGPVVGENYEDDPANLQTS